MRVTRSRPHIGQEAEEPSLADRARALLEARQNDRVAAKSVRKGRLPPPDHPRLPPSAIRGVEHTDSGGYILKATKAKEHKFDIRVRVYGVIPDWSIVYDAIRPQLKEAQAALDAAYGGAHCYIELLHNRGRDDTDKEEEPV